MFVLDTNVLSALMRLEPIPTVAAWIASRPLDLLFTAAVCQSEILAGLAVMQDSRRRRDLEAAAWSMFAEDFSGRILPFDTECAVVYAELFANRRRMGRPATTIDLMVASIARTHGASVVTRDTGGFEGCGLTVIDPWNAS